MDTRELDKIRKEMRKNDPRWQKADQRDIQLAYLLLTGANDESPTDKNGVYHSRFLARDTKPTEKEARAALARVLLSIDAPRMILYCVAALFDPKTADMGSIVPLRVDFKNLNQGHQDHVRDFTIGELVEKLRNSGTPYSKATEDVAAKLGMSTRQIQRIYAKRFPKSLPRTRRAEFRAASRSK